MHASIPDAQLLDRWRTRRDADAFAELVSRYGPLVYSACLRVLRCRTAAEDAAQDCFVELFQSRARVRSLASFLHVTATHRALDRLKAEKRRGEREARFAAAQPVAAQPDWDDLSAMIDDAVAHLPEKLRQPVILRFLQGRTYAEIASEAGLPISTVQYRINQGIEGIRGQLAKRGLAVGATALSTMLAAAPSHAMPGAAAAKLGTLALAGGGAATLSTIANSTLGGMLAMKSIAAVLILLGAAALAAILLLESDPPEAASIAIPPAPLKAPDAEPAAMPASIPPGPALNTPEVSPARESAETPRHPLGSMAGRVFTSEGAPLADWTVIARSPSHEAQVMTNESGEFLLEGLPPGDYVLRAAHPASGRHAEHDRDLIQLRPGEEISGLEVVLHTGSMSLAGYVTRDDGAPVPNVVVSTYYTFESLNGQEVQQLKTKTGEDGRYTLSGFPDVPALSVNVEIEDEDFFSIHRAGVALDGHEEDFMLERKPTISGWVRDAQTREPVTGFRLDHWPVDVADSAPESDARAEFVHRQELASRGDGAFSLQARGYEAIRIAVAAPGYLTSLKTLTSVKPGSVVEGVEILLQPAKPRSGVVVDEAGAGIAGARIYLGHPEFADPRSGYSILGAEGITTTDSTGAFTLTEYPPTLSIVSAQQDGYAVAWADASGTSPIRITLTRGATVEGVVTLDGASVGDRRARISIGYGHTTVVSTGTEEDGSFRVEHAPTGLLSISAGLSVDGLTPRIEREATLSSGEAHYLNFDFDTQRAAYLEGVVLVDGEPLETARLVAKTTLANGDRMTYWIDARSDGTYRLGPVPAGEYEFGLFGFPLPGRSTRYPEPETVTLQEGEKVTYDLIYTSR